MASAIEVHLCVSESGKTVLGHEAGWDGENILGFLLGCCTVKHPCSSLRIYSENDFCAAGEWFFH